MTAKRTRFASVPVGLQFPDPMEADIEGVLNGEYEAGYDGEGLTILDIGANVGAFTIWAQMRWPNSTIHAYEPGPETFRMLRGNVGHLSNVTCHEAAVYPEGPERQLLYSQYAGDGESGLAAYIGDTFRDPPDSRMVAVSVVHPQVLPKCDVVKIDVEGGEAAIVQAMALDGVSLILIEYQNMANRRAIEHHLQDRFVCQFSDCYPWGPLLNRAGYRQNLAGDSYGHLFYACRSTSRMRTADVTSLDVRNRRPVEPSKLSLRRLFAELPRAAHRAVVSRLNRSR